MQRDKDFEQKRLVLFLDRQQEPVDYAPKNLQHLGNSVVVAILIDKLKEDKIDVAPNHSTEIEELAVDPMKSRF